MIPFATGTVPAYQRAVSVSPMARPAPGRSPAASLEPSRRSSNVSPSRRAPSNRQPSPSRCPASPPAFSRRAPLDVEPEHQPGAPRLREPHPEKRLALRLLLAGSELRRARITAPEEGEPVPKLRLETPPAGLRAALVQTRLTHRIQV